MIGLLKNESGGKIIKKFAALRPKMYSCFTDDGFVDNKTKGTKSVIKTKN